MIIAELDLDEMPKTCAYCRYRLRTTRNVMCSLVPIEGDITKRPEKCPLDEVYEKAEPRYCDRNICTENEYNGISCDTCYIAQNYNLEDDDSPCLNCGVEW